jgi:hypothetical protein
MYMYEQTRNLYFCLCFQTWMYLAVPVLFYACERTIRKIRENSYRVSILKVFY